jgi:hypothetical protein
MNHIKFNWNFFSNAKVSLYYNFSIHPQDYSVTIHNTIVRKITAVKTFKSYFRNAFGEEGFALGTEYGGSKFLLKVGIQLTCKVTRITDHEFTV